LCLHFVCSFAPLVEGHELAMGDFSTIFMNDIILNYIWRQICKIPSWEDKVLLFLTLHLTSKAWKKLLNSNQKWAHCKLALLKVWFQEQRVDELRKEQKLKETTTQMTLTRNPNHKICWQHLDIELRVSAHDMWFAFN
jgi:hypothetical protein